MLGLSVGELSFVAILVVIVLLAQVVPTIGEAIGARFGGKGEPPKGTSEDGGGRPPSAEA